MLGLHLEMKDSLRQAASESRLMNLQSVYGLKNKDMEIERLQQGIALDNARLEGHRILILALAIGLGLIFVAFVAMWLYLRARSKLHREVAAKNFALSKANDALAASIQEREALLHMMIHDLKAPLHNSEAMLSVLKEMEGMPDNCHLVLDKMSRNNLRGIELIADLLGLYELEAKTELQMTEVDCGELLSSIAAAMEGQAQQKSIQIQLDIPAQAVLQSNPGMLRRILENLCTNAIKFSAKGTTVQLGLEQKVDGIRLYVKDQGPGISQEEQKLLFQKFTKLSNRPTGGEHSNGLGLAIVKALAERLGARVGLSSQIGEGSKFWVEIPN
jgi:signal transduction histidine kinase